MNFEHPKFERFVQHRITIICKVVGKSTLQIFWNAGDKATTEKQDFRSKHNRDPYGFCWGWESHGTHTSRQNGVKNVVFSVVFS